MKTLQLLLIICLFSIFSSCKKEESNELNITYTKTPPSEKSVVVPPQQSDIAVFPNPFLTSVNMQIVGGNIGERSIIIRSSDGKFKKVEDINNQITIDFSQEPRGVYYCEVKIGTSLYQKKLYKIGE